MDISKVVTVAKIVFIIFIALAVIGVAFFVLIYKKKKSKNLKEEQDVDYSTLNRKDARDYVKISDISNDMYVMDNGRTYVAAIICQGSDFWALPAGERLGVKKGYVSFLGTLKKPITMRQTSKAVDLEGHIAKYQNILAEAEKEVVTLSLDHEEMKFEAEKARQMQDYKGLDILVTAMEAAARKIEVLNNKINHIKDEIEFQRILSNGISTTDREENYIFSWTYVPKDGEIAPSEELIRARAKQELANMANAYISALSNANVRARRCTTLELEIMAKRHFHPVTGGQITYGEYINGSDFVDIVTADDSAMLDAAKEELLNEMAIQFGQELSAESDGGEPESSTSEGSASENSESGGDDMAVDTQLKSDPKSRKTDRKEYRNLGSTGADKYIVYDDAQTETGDSAVSVEESNRGL